MHVSLSCLLTNFLFNYPVFGTNLNTNISTILIIIPLWDIHWSCSPMKLKPNCKVPRLNPKYLAKPCTIQVNRKCNMAATRGIPRKNQKGWSAVGFIMVLITVPKKGKKGLVNNDAQMICSSNVQQQRHEERADNVPQHVRELLFSLDPKTARRP